GIELELRQHLAGRRRETLRHDRIGGQAAGRQSRDKEHHGPGRAMKWRECRHEVPFPRCYMPPARMEPLVPPRSPVPCGYPRSCPEAWQRDPLLVWWI